MSRPTMPNPVRLIYDSGFYIFPYDASHYRRRGPLKLGDRENLPNKSYSQIVLSDVEHRIFEKLKHQIYKTHMGNGVPVYLKYQTVFIQRWLACFPPREKQCFVFYVDIPHGYSSSKEIHIKKKKDDCFPDLTNVCKKLASVFCHTVENDKYIFNNPHRRIIFS